MDEAAVERLAKAIWPRTTRYDSLVRAVLANLTPADVPKPVADAIKAEALRKAANSRSPRIAHGLPERTTSWEFTSQWLRECADRIATGAHRG